MNDVPSLQVLLKQLQQVPYLASKNIYRVASYFLSMDAKRAEQFCHAIQAAKENIIHCPQCFTWVEKDRNCLFCQSPRRNKKIICVVETWQELIAIEKTGGYQGVYHVLGGAISPLDGINPDDLTIKELIARVSANEIDEVILATNQTPEGEATAAFISSQIHKIKLSGGAQDQIGKAPIKVTCLARGIPVGSSLEYMDRLTVFKALSERRPF